MYIYRRTIALMIVFIVVIITLTAWQWQNLQHFVQLTHLQWWGIGLVLLIIIIFLLGYLRMMIMLEYYFQEQREVMQITKLLNNVENENIETQLSPNSLICQRLKTVKLIASQKGKINQSTLAAIVSAEQSSRFTLIRYVQNTLILSGVLGTVLSLSVVLTNSAALLNAQADMNPLIGVVGGMSTALLTTVTAIVLFMIYAYFHMKLQDLRMRFLASLEEVTTLYFLPRYQGLSVQAHELTTIAAKQMQTSMQSVIQGAQTVAEMEIKILNISNSLQQLLNDLQQNTGQSKNQLQEIAKLVRTGFRLDNNLPAKNTDSLEKPADNKLDESIHNISPDFNRL